MNKQMGYALGGLVLGIVLTLAVQQISKPKVTQPEHQMSNGQMMQDNPSTQGTMDGVTTSLKSKTGDDFDKEFLSEMTTHHQGAIDMANLALQNAKHQEIKDLAKNIILAQTNEINQMKQWQKNWYNH